MIFRLLMFITLAFLSSTAFAQNIGPLELAKKIFSREPFPEISRYSGGEYEGKPNGEDIKEGATLRFLVLGQTENKAVVAMTITDSAGKGLDTYLHFEKGEIWQLHAFRALALTGIIELMLNELEKMKPEQIDEIIEKAKTEKDPDNIIFSSREEYDHLLGNTRLTLALDDDIIRHFQEHKGEFERLKDSALKELDGKDRGDRRSIGLLENQKSDYKKLLISSVAYGDYKLGGKCLDFYIGGMQDNTVGYLYVKDKKDLPEMTDRLVIMIREIGDGWYIYKTT